MMKTSESRAIEPMGRTPLCKSRLTKNVILVMEAWGVGGTETYVKGLVGVLERRGIDVSLVLLRTSHEKTIDFIPSNRIHQTGLVGLLTLLLRKRPAVVNLHLYSHLFPVVALCKSMRCRTITTLHMPLEAWGVRNRYFWRRAVGLSSCVVGVSNHVISQLSGENICKTPIPGGVGHHFFCVKRKTARKKTDNFKIIAIGRLSVEKDWPTLIKAVAMLPDHIGEKVSIDFYGSGYLQVELEEIAHQCMVRVRFHGYVGDHALDEALGEADLSVMPSRFEGLGLSAIECMASGIPTITANFPAANDFIKHGVTGHIFSAGDIRQLSGLIEWHIFNPEKSSVIGECAAKSVKEVFSVENAYMPYLQLLVNPGKNRCDC